MEAWRRLYLDTKLDASEVALVSLRLEVASQPRNLLQIHSLLDQFEAQALAVNAVAFEPVYDAFKTAVVEIATNILRHAYPPGYPTNPVSIQLSLFPTRIEAIFHDQGIAFTPPTQLAPPELDDIMDLPEGNLGLFLALQALDHLEYSRTHAGVNQWRLAKLLPLPS